jgi:hypothetical protein
MLDAFEALGAFFILGVGALYFYWKIKNSDSGE